MHPYLIHAGRLYLPTFGVLAAVGLMAALSLSERTARLLGLRPDRLWDAGIFAIVAAFVLSRLLLVVENWHTFLSFPVLLLAVPSLTPWGLALAGLATLVYLRVRRIAVLSALDAWAPCATLVWAALALGHFAEGSDPGLPASHFPAMQFAGQPTRQFPVALYAAALAVLLTGWLSLRLRRQAQIVSGGPGFGDRRAGSTAARALLATGLGQFLLSFLREPGSTSWAGLDALEWVSLAMFVAGGLLLALGAWLSSRHDLASSSASRQIE